MPSGTFLSFQSLSCLKPPTVTIYGGSERKGDKIMATDWKGKTCNRIHPPVSLLTEGFYHRGVGKISPPSSQWYLLVNIDSEVLFKNTHKQAYSVSPDRPSYTKMVSHRPCALFRKEELYNYIA